VDISCMIKRMILQSQRHFQSLWEALNAVRLLISYMEGQDVPRASLLPSSERLERDLGSEIITSWTQGTLDS